MNEWELTDEDLEREASFGAMEYCDRIPREGQFIDEEIVAGQRAVATAAQKKLVEWLNERCMEHLHDASIARTERSDCAECWAMIEAALGVKDED